MTRVFYFSLILCSQALLAEIEDFNLKSKVLSQGKLVKSDHLIFKIVDKIYSLNDLKGHYHTLRSFDCSYPDSYFISNLQMRFKNYKSQLKTFDQPPFYGNQYFQPLEKNLFQKLLLANKIITYIEIQDIKLTKSLYRSILDSAGQAGCQLKYIVEDNWFTPLFEKALKVEVFLRSRFKQESFVITKDELRLFQKKTPNLNIEQVENTLKKRKLRKSVSIIMNSIDKQVDHEVFW